MKEVRMHLMHESDVDPLQDVPRWEDEPTVVAAARAVTDLEARCAALDLERQQQWAEAQAIHGTAHPPHWHPCWAPVAEHARAEHQLRLAREHYRSTTERAKAKLQAVAYQHGRRELEAGLAIVEQLAIWLESYEALQGEMLARTGTQPPHLGFLQLDSRSVRDWQASVFTQQRFG
jgi:hypothetical protein